MFLFKTAEVDANCREATELTDSSFQLVFIFMIRRWNLAKRRRWRRPLRQSRRRWAAVASLGQSSTCGYVSYLRSWIHENVSFLLLLLSLPLRTFSGAASCKLHRDYSVRLLVVVIASLHSLFGHSPSPVCVQSSITCPPPRPFKKLSKSFGTQIRVVTWCWWW